MTFSAFDDRYLLTKVLDADGNFVSLDYEGEKLARITCSNGRWIVIDRDHLGRVGSNWG